MSFEHEDRFLLCVKGTSLIMIVMNTSRKWNIDVKVIQYDKSMSKVQY